MRKKYRARKNPGEVGGGCLGGREMTRRKEPSKFYCEIKGTSQLRDDKKTEE